MTEVTYHGEYMQKAQPAVCVKDRHNYNRDFEHIDANLLPEHVKQQAYDFAREMFWNEVQSLSEAYGYGKSYSEGRSDGWLVVDKPPVFDDDPDFDVNDMALKEWKLFEQAVHDLMDHWRKIFLEELEKMVKRRSVPLNREVADEDIRKVGA